MKHRNKKLFNLKAKKTHCTTVIEIVCKLYTGVLTLHPSVHSYTGITRTGSQIKKDYPSHTNYYIP